MYFFKCWGALRYLATRLTSCRYEHVEHIVPKHRVILASLVPDCF